MIISSNCYYIQPCSFSGANYAVYLHFREYNHNTHVGCIYLSVIWLSEDTAWRALRRALGPGSLILMPTLVCALSHIYCLLSAHMLGSLKVRLRFWAYFQCQAITGRNVHSSWICVMCTDPQKQYADAVIQVLPTQLIPDDNEGKVLRVRMVMKEGVKYFEPVYLFDEGSTINWIPCGRKLTCSYPGIKFFYGPDTYYGNEVLCNLVLHDCYV